MQLIGFGWTSSIRNEPSGCKFNGWANRAPPLPPRLLLFQPGGIGDLGQLQEEESVAPRQVERMLRGIGRDDVAHQRASALLDQVHVDRLARDNVHERGLIVSVRRLPSPSVLGLPVHTRLAWHDSLDDESALLVGLGAAFVLRSQPRRSIRSSSREATTVSCASGLPPTRSVPSIRPQGSRSGRAIRPTAARSTRHSRGRGAR